ncbi:MAG: response regulator [Bacteroidota bacterium]
MEKILVINNDLDTMNLLKNWLEKKAYSVDYTSNSNDIPVLIKNLHPSLIIVDVMQKDVIQEIKNNQELSRIPILLMTGYTSKHRRKDVPYDDVIEKPFNLSILQQKIESLIAQHMVADNNHDSDQSMANYMD